MQIASYLLLIFSMVWVSESRADSYFVSPDGSDNNSGTIEDPFATLKKASGVLQPGDTCFLRAGVYRGLLRPGQSGRPGAPIVYTSYRNEKVVISGADLISGWKKQGSEIYSAPMPWNLSDGNQVFANGRMLNEASWPTAVDNPLFKPRRAEASGGSETTLTCGDIPGSEKNWEGAELWCAGGKAWICWTSEVTGFNPNTHTLTFDQARESWYTPEEGNLFVLRGVKYALDDPGEWFYDSEAQRLLLIPPKNARPEKLTIEAKRRMDAMNLSGRSYIHIKGIDFRAGGIRTDKASSHIVLENLRGRYVSHSYTEDVSSESGVLIFGNHIDVISCDLGYSSASVVTVKGHDNRVINCKIHRGGYSGLWRGTVALSGRRNVFSHNTVRHAGRDLVNTHGLMESLVQYNDVSEAGWLTKDLGMFYGHNTDFANTVFRYNHVHDNRAEHLSMGIYFDHLSNNAIVHHNVVWNVGWDPIRFNNPSYCNLVFNNTSWNTGDITTFDHADRGDLFANRFYNNVFNGPVELPEHVAVENNLIMDNPPFKNVEGLDFRLDTSIGNVGAYQPDKRLWQTGHDFANPPDPLPTYEPPHIAWMNMIDNACFEFGTFEDWNKTDASQATLEEGNGWGVDHSTGNYEATGTSDYVLRLGPGRDGVNQVIRDLSPGVTYTLSAWMKVSDDEETIVLGVKNYGAEEVSVSTSSSEWVRKSVEFTTGPGDTKATIYLIKSSGSGGYAWGDNLTLPLRPKNTESNENF